MIESISLPQNIIEAERQEESVIYNRLLELVQAGKLEIIHIVSTPRSSSTALEKGLSQGEDIDFQMNDPWAGFDQDRENQTFAAILDKVDAYLQTSPRAKIIIKDIADYIISESSWEKMQSLVKSTIFLTRNPLIQMESMMQIMAKGISGEDAFGDGTVDEWSLSKGYESWKEMQTAVKRKRDYTDYQEIYAHYFAEEQPIFKDQQTQYDILKSLSDMDAQKIGYQTVREYSQAKGYSSWDQLLKSISANEELLEQVRDILDQHFLTRITGWDALRKHYVATVAAGKKPIAVDSTLYRAFPGLVLPKIVEQTNSQFSDSLIEWEATSKTFSTDYEGDVPYYDKAAQSTKILPPTETPLPLDRFPPFITTHIVEQGGALETYLLVLEDAIENNSELDYVQLLKRDSNGTILLEIDPVFSYAVLSLQPHGNEHIINLLQELERKFPEFEPVFKIITTRKSL